MKNNHQNTAFNVQEIRKDFPILNRKINGKPLVYFDNAATSQTPQQVIDVIVNYYSWCSLATTSFSFPSECYEEYKILRSC